MTPTVLFPFVGDTVGGSHISARLLIDALPAVGFTPVVLLHGEGPLADWLREQSVTFRCEAGFPVFAGPRLLALLRLIFALPAMISFLRRNDIHIVHANDARMNLTWALAARLAGVRYILHQRTRYAPSRLPLMASRLAHRLIAISAWVRSTLPPDLAARAEILANPVAFAALPPRTATKARFLRQHGFRADARLVAFVANMTEQKRPLVFLDVARRLVEHHSDAVFVMAGRAQGAIGDVVLRAIMELGLERRVILAGFVSQPELILRAADVLVAPAVDEGWGRSLLEAMAAETPVVAARSGGHLEIVEDGRNGLLADVDDAGAFCSAVEQLLVNAELTAALVAGGLQTAAAFTPSHHAQAVAMVYRRLLGE